MGASAAPPSVASFIPMAETLLPNAFSRAAARFNPATSLLSSANSST